MYEKILVPLDESHMAEHVLPCVRTLARCFQIPVELLRVLDLEEVKIDMNSNLVVKLRSDSSEYLEQIKRTFASPERVTGAVQTGKPAETILDRASDELETLISMSTHSRSGVENFFMGSVANKVLLGTKSPLLLIRGKEETPDPGGDIDGIVLPLDGSALSELALPHAIVLADKLGAAVHLVRAYSVAKYASASNEGMALEYPKFLEQEEQTSRAYLEAQAQLLQSKGLDTPYYITQEGDAAVLIADVAQSIEGSALIVMSSHGESGIGRWLLGGTADRVVRYSESPVLIIRPPLHD